MAATVTHNERPERTTDSIKAELADLRHQAGRMTTADDRYASLHDRISALVDELLT